MLARVLTGATAGLDGVAVDVEVDIAQGLPGFNVVGLPDVAVQEARERVRAAVRNSGYTFPLKRVTVNLAPAEVRKEGTGYDVPIAVGVLAASGDIPLPPEPTMFLGQLSLDGGLRHTTGILPLVALAREQNVPTVIVPAVDAPEAALIAGVQVIPVPTLADLTRHLTGERPIAPFGANGRQAANGCSALDAPFPQDLADVRGQEHARRALEVAAAGGHNLLLTGVPGAGKTLLARCLPSILPPLTLDEALEVTRVYSVCGLLQPEQPLIRQRPFRAPHHTISHAGLVGGGSPPRPGELSLAHRGVLFLDELPEFDLHTLETLRQPLEAGQVTIARARGAATFPSQVTLVAAMNPCPCGYFGDSLRRCVCSDGALLRYRRRLSGPLLDRIDMHLEVSRVPYAKLTVGAEDEEAEELLPPPEPSAPVRARVIAARERQLQRFAGSAIACNAAMGPGDVRRFARTDGAGEQMMRQATARLGLSARAYHRVLKLARTIADLDGKDVTGAAHVAEALQYRPRSET